jgi:hypothetical protein
VEAQVLFLIACVWLVGWLVAAVQVNQTFAKKFDSGLQKSAPNVYYSWLYF